MAKALRIKMPPAGVPQAAAVAASTGVDVSDSIGAASVRGPHGVRVTIKLMTLFRSSITYVEEQNGVAL
jgi:hypothetical protein